MEPRNGLIEFRTVYEPVHGKRNKTRKMLQYRQCFNGMWTAWKNVDDEGEE